MIQAKLPDGRTLEFPDGTDQTVIQSKVRELLGVEPMDPATPAAPTQPPASPIQTPSPRAVSGVSTETPQASTGMSVPEAIIEEAPQTIGGIGGGLIGATSAVAQGAGAIKLAPILGGVALGAGAGEAVKQMGQHLSGSLNAPKTSLEAAKRIGKASLTETGYELVGGLVAKGFAKILSPFASSMKEGVEEAMSYFKDKISPVLLPAEATESRVLDIIHNISESSLIGGNQIARFKNDRIKFFDDYADSFIDKFGERTDPTDLGNLFVTALEAKKKLHKEAAGAMYNAVDDMVQGTTVVGPLTDDEMLKFIDRMSEGVGADNSQALKYLESIGARPEDVKAVDDLIKAGDNSGLEAAMDSMTVPRMAGGVRISTASLKEFAQKQRVRSRDLGNIEAKNAGDDLMDAIMNLPDDIPYGAAQELRSRLISRADEFSVLNRKAPAVGKAKKLAGMVDGEIEKSLKGYKVKGGLAPVREPGMVRVYHGRGTKLKSGSRFEQGGVHFAEDGSIAAEFAIENAPGKSGFIHTVDIDPNKYLVMEDVPNRIMDKEDVWDIEELGFDWGKLWSVNAIKKKMKMDPGLLADQGVNITDSEIDAIKSGASLFKLLKEKGFDGIKYRNDVEKGPGYSFIVNPGEMKNTKSAGISSDSDVFHGAPVDELFGGEESPLQLWRDANRFYRTGQEKLNNTFLRRMVKLADDTGTGAETIAPAVFKPGHVTNVRRVKRALGEGSPEWNNMRSFFVQHLFSKSTDVDGNIIGKRILNNISGKPNSFGEPMLREILTEPQIRELQAFARVLQETQARQADGAGRTLIQLAQGGAMANVVMKGASVPAVTVLLGPVVPGKMMTNPTAAKILTEGIQMPANSEAAAGLMSRLIAAGVRVQQRVAGGGDQ